MVKNFTVNFLIFISNLLKLNIGSICNSFILLLVLVCCTPSGKEKNKKTIARVFDNYLYESDIKDIVSKATSPQDSVLLLKKYIDNWIRETLIIHKAETNLSDEQKNVEKQLKDYRNSLINFIYEKALVQQKLDTIVKNAEIEDYYNKNKANFELKDNIIKVLYIKVNKKAPYLDKVKKWYTSDNVKDRKLLQSYCYQFAENFYLDDNTWLLFDDLLKEIPIETYNKELFLENNRFIDVQDSSHYYFVNIKGFKIKNSLSPLAFEKENIRNIIMNKRKLLLIEKMKNDIYNDALKNKKFEIY